MFVCGGLTSCWIVCCGVTIVFAEVAHLRRQALARTRRRLKPPPAAAAAAAEPAAAWPAAPPVRRRCRVEPCSFWKHARILSCSAWLNWKRTRPVTRQAMRRPS